MIRADSVALCVAFLFAGAATPVALPLLEKLPCLTGCLLEQAVSGQGCPAITAIWVPRPGSQTGSCSCQSHVCKEATQCDLTVDFTFTITIPYAGCVYDRAPGQPWGHTGYSATVKGCGAHGTSRELGWSRSCDPQAPMDCTMTFTPYCSSCTGRHCD